MPQSDPVYIDLDGYDQWLQSFNPNEIVGIKGEPNKCPVKNYLASVDSTITAVGFNLAYRNDHEDDANAYEIVPNVCTLIVNIDQSYAKEITATQALKVLYAFRERVHI